MSVSDEEQRRVGDRAWLELLHAEACWLLAGAGVDALVIKGPSTTRWLYPDHWRTSVDVDLLVRPAQWDAAVATLGERGFRSAQKGFRDDEGAPHSRELRRVDADQGDHVIDLHRSVPGVDAAAADAFGVLWERRVAEQVARVDVWFPDLPSRALILALHAARTPGNPRPGDDLARALVALDEAGWRATAALAGRLDALPALRAGLQTRPEGAELADRLGLGEVEVPAHWALLSNDADQTAVRLEELGHLPWYRRPGQAMRWAFPSPAFVRAGDPRAQRGPVGLAVAYGARLVDGARRFPAAYRQYRASRR
jgi:hypothetical protein